nr:MAG TPA_asm: hypothetical protein [Caudoviricetes sp.]DAZ71953.1 MAG TPA: hypothetical protein [Caudoviricetes sp.]
MPLPYPRHELHDGSQNLPSVSHRNMAKRFFTAML